MRKTGALASSFFLFVAFGLAQWSPGGHTGKVAWAAYLGLVSFFFLYWFFTCYRRLRLLEDTPTAPIGTAPQGYIEIVGRAENLPEATVTAPLSKDPCVWYRYSVEERRRSGRNTHWVTIDSGESAAGFLVRDDTGAAVVLPAGADVFPTVDRTWGSGGLWTDAPPPAGWGNRLFVGFHRYKFHEEYLPLQGPVHVAGWFETVQPHRSLETDVNNALKDIKKDAAKMNALADHNRDGRVDPEEWDALRARVRADLAELNARRPEIPAVHTMMVPVDDSLPFLISGEGEQRAGRYYRLGSVLGLLGFLLAGGACVYVLEPLSRR